jgi:protein-S-isoprenylcysteine O-methyltransferase Ste14
MTVSMKSLVIQLGGLFMVFALILFLSAGTIGWVAGWAFLILFFVPVLLLTTWLVKNSPGVLNERLAGMMQKDQKAWDKVVVVILNLAFFGGFIFMALDGGRYHWSQVPGWVQVLGGILMLLGLGIISLVFRENSFLSAVVRVQDERGQTVVSTGPYHYVRHPMYAGAIFFIVGITLLLGSWYGLIPGLILLIVIARRAVMEEETLRQELQGYDTYMNQVKYRLIPGLW